MIITQNSQKISCAAPERNLMSHHNSYHHSITGEEAERRLKIRGGDCYLTRYSEANKCFILSVHKQQSPKNVINTLRS